jgi:dihydrofolate reductase
MGTLKLVITMSLDGYVAGPSQSVENPLGIGGEGLHELAIALEAWRTAHGYEDGETNASSPVIQERLATFGATIMGRNMFGGQPGQWSKDDPWNGWWGDEPPFHHPVFVLTHHPREPLVCEGGTTFTFVTDGIESALAQAREAAGDKKISLSGGAEVCRQYLAADLVDEMEIDLVPIFLGDGERLFEGLGVGNPKLTCVRTIDAPGVRKVRDRDPHQGDALFAQERQRLDEELSRSREDIERPRRRPTHRQRSGGPRVVVEAEA